MACEFRVTRNSHAIRAALRHPPNTLRCVATPGHARQTTTRRIAMKRIAALAALMITMLAVPATAMASTGADHGGPGYGTPRLVQVACPFPSRLRKGHFNVKVYARAYLKARLKAHWHGKPIRIICPYIPAKPLPKGCKPEILRFDMAAGGSTLTEVSGPTLAPTQEFIYHGSTYTIMSINPGADSFTVFVNGFLLVNKGAAITDGIGFMGCAR